LRTARPKFSRWIAAVALVLSLAAIASAVACSSGSKKSDATPIAQSSAAGQTAGATAAATSAARTTPAVAAASAAPGPATFSVIAGKADAARDIEMFMPADIRVRVGDTIEWTAQGFEGHTITFATPDQITNVFKSYLLPDPDDPAQVMFNPVAALKSDTPDTFAGDGAYHNSGFIGVPVEAKYKLTFAKQGVYQYLCLVHPFTMRGTVSVDAADARVDAPATVAAKGAADLARYMDVEARALAAAAGDEREAPGPAGATVYHVAVGLTTPYGQVAAFVKPVLDIKAGDTVIFEGDDRDFHNVIFKGALKELPPGVGIKTDPQGRGINYTLSKASAVAVDPPPEGFDDKTFLSSGSLGITMPRITWRLTFDKPGTYIYNCTIHVLAGMAGVINVR
jgi:plastocyanin